MSSGVGGPDPASPAGLIRLGASDLWVSPLGVGAWAWGDRLFWGYRGRRSDADLEAAFRASLERGITLFDTAEIYGWGLSEKLIGRFAGRAATSTTIATKFMPFPWRLGRGSLLAALRSSLRRLGREHVDLYQIHMPLPPIAIETWADALADAVDAGLARTVGVSNYDARQVVRAHAALAARGIPLVSNQIEYSLLRRAPERDGVIDTCNRLGVTVIAYSPLALGMLTGKYTAERPPPGWRRLQYGKGSLRAIRPLIDLLRAIGEDRGGRTPAQVALNWLMCRGALPIPGAKSARQAEENAGALGWRLGPKDLAALDTASRDLAAW